jgi:hypothetical protein
MPLMAKTTADKGSLVVTQTLQGLKPPEENGAFMSCLKARPTRLISSSAT